MSKALKCVTLTGADEKTPLRELGDLAARAGVEIGLLFSCTSEGRNRYPSRYWLERAVTFLGQSCAVHVCGREARRLALAGGLPWLRHAGRVQINGAPTVGELFRALDRYPSVITQHSAKTADLDRLAFIGHSLLVDASGGRGLSPEVWERPETEKDVGFAGGLGPENLSEELPRIAAVAEGTWWIDMESKLRGEDDWFCLRKAHAAVDAVHAWARQSMGGKLHE